MRRICSKGGETYAPIQSAELVLVLLVVVLVFGGDVFLHCAMFVFVIVFAEFVTVVAVPFLGVVAIRAIWVTTIAAADELDFLVVVAVVVVIAVTIIVVTIAVVVIPVSITGIVIIWAIVAAAARVSTGVTAVITSAVSASVEFHAGRENEGKNSQEWEMNK